MTTNELFENWFCLLQLFASVAINLRTGNQFNSFSRHFYIINHTSYIQNEQLAKEAIT